MSTEAEPECLYGAREIAVFLGWPEKVTRHRIDNKTIPTFRIGRTVCARPARLRDWLAEQERKAGQGGGQ